MGVTKLCFKFLNYEVREWYVIEVWVHCSKVEQWTYNEKTELSDYIDWLSKHAEWEHKLKRAIKRQIREFHSAWFNGENNDYNPFGDYRIIKKVIKKECAIVNMNAHTGNEPFIFREIEGMEIIKMKFERGSKPVDFDWPIIFNWPKNVVHYTVIIAENQKPEDAKLQSQLYIPEEYVEDLAPSSTSRTNTLKSQWTDKWSVQGRPSDQEAPGFPVKRTTKTGSTVPVEQESMPKIRKPRTDIISNYSYTNPVPKPSATTNLPKTGTPLGTRTGTSVLGTNTGTQSQVGGNWGNDDDDKGYEDRYHKYKKKYVNLKQKLR